ncbi:MAG: hypothetical protein WC822_03040 [Candidatus Paceibacterota bacterium]
MALSALFLSGATLAAGAMLGIVPPPLGIAKRLIGRVACATGLNMYMARNKKESDTESANNTQSKAKEFFFKNSKLIQNASMVGGVGVSYLLSGGTVAVVAAIGIALRKTLNYISDRKIKERSQQLKDLDINKFVNKLDKFEEEYNKLTKSLERWKWGKNIMNGATTIGVGVATMSAGLHHQTEIHEKRIEDIKKQILKKMGPKDAPKIDHQFENDREEGVKKELEKIEKRAEEIKMQNDTMVRKGEGVEHTFIRQIEHQPKLAQQLGYKGDINDIKALREFAQREAHIVALKTGFVDDKGHEVRISEADKVGYKIEIEKNGELKVIQNAVGKIEYNYTKNNSQTEINSNATTGQQTEFIDTSTNSEQVDTTYKSIIEDITPKNATEKVLQTWNQIKDSRGDYSAQKLISWKTEDAGDIFKPLVSKIHKLYEITNLKPAEGNAITLAETPTEYILRATKKAIEMGQLEEIK